MFNHQTKTIGLAAFILAVSSLVSRFLGLIRDRLLAGHFGAGQELDIYFAAFRIPDFVYGVLIAGGITVAFLPVFSEYFQKKEENANSNPWPTQALEFASNLLNCFLISLVVICGILAIFAPLVVDLVIPGFGPESRSITIALTRIMFLSPVFFGISSIFSGILQYFNRFLAYSLAPILYNCGIIFGIIFFVPHFGIYGLAFGVILGAFLHLLIQIPAAINSGFRYKQLLNFWHPGLVKIFKLMIPRTVGITIDQINLVIITALASVLSPGSISIFNFSNNIQYFPIGIIGVSFAISAFPVFSKFIANGQKKEFLGHFASSFRQIVFFIIPLSFAIFLLRAQIIRLVLGTGLYNWEATRLTAACLGFFCLGILAESLIALISRAFYAFQDTKTPVVIGIISVLANIVLCLVFIFLLGFPNVFYNFLVNFLKLGGIKSIEVLGLPLGLSLAGIIQLVLLLIFLYRKIGDFGIKEILKSLEKVVLASVLMGLSIYFALQVVSALVDMKTYFGIFLQAAIAALVGIFVYLVSAHFLKSPETAFAKQFLLRQFRGKLYPNGSSKN